MQNEHGMLDHQGTRASEEERQSKEWEAVLADVTVEPRKSDVLFAPHIMELIMAEYGERYARYLADSSFDSAERLNQLRRIKEVAARKLSGRLRDCFLAFVIAGKSFRQISLDMGIAPESVRRSVDRAMKDLLPIFENRTGEFFPSERNQAWRSVILPLDTDPERAAFQKFINEHVIHHIGYACAPDAREALILWSPMPDIGRKQRDQASARTDFVDAMLRAEEEAVKKPETLH